MRRSTNAIQCYVNAKEITDKWFSAKKCVVASRVDTTQYMTITTLTSEMRYGEITDNYCYQVFFSKSEFVKNEIKIGY